LTVSFAQALPLVIYRLDRRASRAGRSSRRRTTTGLSDVSDLVSAPAERSPRAVLHRRQRRRSVEALEHLHLFFFPASAPRATRRREELLERAKAFRSTWSKPCFPFRLCCRVRSRQNGAAQKEHEQESVCVVVAPAKSASSNGRRPRLALLLTRATPPREGAGAAARSHCSPTCDPLLRARLKLGSLRLRAPRVADELATRPVRSAKEGPSTSHNSSALLLGCSLFTSACVLSVLVLSSEPSPDAPPHLRPRRPRRSFNLRLRIFLGIVSTRRSERPSSPRRAPPLLAQGRRRAYRALEAHEPAGPLGGTAPRERRRRLRQPQERRRAYRG